MSETQLVTLFSVVITSGTALLVAYLHRKQIRQIEMFRLDPRNTSLLPPPHPIRLFLSRNFAFFMTVPYVVFLVLHLIDQKPLTRHEVFLIALDVASIVALVILQLLQTIVGRIIDIQSKQLDLIRGINEDLANVRIAATTDPNTPPARS